MSHRHRKEKGEGEENVECFTCCKSQIENNRLRTGARHSLIMFVRYKDIIGVISPKISNGAQEGFIFFSQNEKNFLLMKRLQTR